MSSLDAELSALSAEAPLGSAWGRPQSFEQVVDISGLELYAVGLLAAAAGGGDVAGSAAGLGAFPVRRAYFELLERSAVLDAIATPRVAYPVLDARGAPTAECARDRVFPEVHDSSWAYSKSNGVAVGPDWPSACRAARAELFERHAVLGAWYGFSLPTQLTLPDDASFARLRGLYDFERFRFPSPEEQGLEVMGVFGFPKRAEAPLVYGFGADDSTERALERAGGECLQRLAFLWGETIPTEEPAFAKTPDYHQELFLWAPMHERLRAWLAGAHAGRAVLSSPSPAPLGSGGAELGFVDLTPEHVAASGARVRVAKALSNSAAPLTFGRGHPWFTSDDSALAVHPIA